MIKGMVVPSFSTDHNDETSSPSQLSFPSTLCSLSFLSGGATTPLPLFPTIQPPTLSLSLLYHASLQLPPTPLLCFSLYLASHLHLSLSFNSHYLSLFLGNPLLHPLPIAVSPYHLLLSTSMPPLLRALIPAFDCPQPPPLSSTFHQPPLVLRPYSSLAE